MLSIAKKSALQKRLHSFLRTTACEGIPRLFCAALLLLLAFFAVAIIHEAIPGLCQADENGEEDCPFCKLVYTLTLLVFLLILALCQESLKRDIRSNLFFSPKRIRYALCPLRAPPCL